MPENLPPDRRDFKLTLLTAIGRRLCKQAIFASDGSVTANEAEQVKAGRNFHATTVAPVDLAEMHEVLREVAGRTDTYPVRAGRADETRRMVYRRYAHTEKDTNDLVDTPTRWLFVDHDDVGDLPDGWLEMPLRQLKARLVSQLDRDMPDGFRRAGRLVHFSARMSPRGGQLRAHCAYLLDRPLTTEETGSLLREVADLGHVDAQLFKAGQPIYTGLQTFDVGGQPIPDPLGARRMIVIDGPEAVVGKVPERSDPVATTFATVAADTLPPETEEELLEMLQPALLRIGDKRHKNDKERLGFREGLRNLTFTYARLTYGKPRDKAWLRQLAISRVLEEGVLLKPTDEAHLRLRTGSDFDKHYAGACKRIDDDPVKWMAGSSRVPDELVEAMQAHWAAERAKATAKLGRKARRALRRSGLPLDAVRRLQTDASYRSLIKATAKEAEDSAALTIIEAIEQGVEVVVSTA